MTESRRTRTYTAHGLSDSMLMTLSAVVHNHASRVRCVSVTALEKRGLVGTDLFSHKVTATVEGFQALADARAAGW